MDIATQDLKPKIAMHYQFEPTDFFNELVSSPQECRVHIVGERVEWCLDIVGGRLLFAAHSLQYLTALETVFSELGYEAALPTYWRLAQLGPYKHKIDEQGLEALGWTSKVVGALTEYKTLNLAQAENTLAKLSEDAIASLLGLDSATVTWHPLPAGTWHLANSGVALLPLLHRLVARLQTWQPLCDRIISPHQRPYCESPEQLYGQVSHGALSPQMLKALVRLMQGASIRQLAQVVKQDELKLAQLLYPYIEHRLIKLWPPVSPLDQLPWLPTQPLLPLSSTAAAAHLTQKGDAWRPLSAQASPLTAGSPPVSHNGVGSGSLPNRPASQAKSRYQVVCIDDNQLVLERIQDYLDSERFEITTCLDPMASIAKLCAIKPDLILLDISMPRIDGHGLCRSLRRSSIFRDIPIIMISSNTSALTKAKARSVGATDYLEKPFSQADLMALLNSYLNQR
ncbi:MAG: response regulator [Cyanobacteria bacterium P01_G01_bin.38]